MKNEREMKQPVNMKVSVSKDKLMITVDLKDYMDKLELSESGKSYIVASSRGNQSLTAKGYEDIKWGCNVFIPAKRVEELRRIAELEAQGGRVVTGLPSQADAELLAKKDAEIAEMRAQMEARERESNAKMARMEQMLEQLMAMNMQNMQAQAQAPQQMALDTECDIVAVKEQPKKTQRKSK